MGFKEELQESIKKSKLSLREISRRCQDDGKPVSQAYISKVLNGDVDPPSEAIIRSISSVIGADPVKLIWSAYIEKAPDSLKDALSGIRDVNTFADNFFKFIYKKTDKEKVLEGVEDSIEKITMGLFYDNLPNKVSFETKLKLIGRIPELLKNNTINVDKKFVSDLDLYLTRHIGVPDGMYNAPIYEHDILESHISGYKLISKDEFQEKEYFYFIVNDESMIQDNIYPKNLVLNHKTSTVNEGDIHLVYFDGKLSFRRVYISEDNYLLQASNREIPPSVKKINETLIIGRSVYVEFKL